MINRIKHVIREKSFKNGIWMYLLQFFNAVVPLLTLPYITRVLGNKNYGIFSVALNIIVYLQVVVEYGFGMSATRKVALNNGDYCKLYWSVFFSRVILFVCCLLFIFAYCFIYHNDLDRCLCFVALMICLIGYCFQMNWLFQGMQDMKFISLVNIIARTISIILIFSFVRDEEDLLLYCFFYAASPFFSGIFGFIVAAIKYQIRPVKVSLNDVLSELKDGFYVFTTQLSSKVFGSIGITFLGIFSTYSEVGTFSAIQKITNIMLLAWSPISQILYPISSKRLSSNYKEGKAFVYKTRQYLLPLFVIMALIVAVLAKPIINILFGYEYAEYYYWIFPLLLWLLLSINNNFLGIQILLGGGFDKEYSKCFQISVVCTIFFNFILIYLFHGTGASIAPALSELVLGVLLKFNILKVEKLQGLKQERK